jgi:hypothetical protein
MTWVKLDDGFPNNPKIVGLSDHSFRLYVSALCYSGKYLTDGFIPQAVVDQLGNPDELLDNGLWEETLGGVYVNNYTEYQTPKAEVERKREISRNRVTRYREKNNATSNALGNALVTHPEYRVQNTENINNYSEDFEKFWNSYPIKIGKGSAFKAWLKALKKADVETIVEGAIKYAKDPNREAEFTAHPATWLNGERWLDSELPEKRARMSSKPLLPNAPVIPRFTADEAPKGVPVPKNIRDIVRQMSDKS